MVALTMPRSVRRSQPERWPHGPALLCIIAICGVLWLGVIGAWMAIMDEVLLP